MATFERFYHVPKHRQSRPYVPEVGTVRPLPPLRPTISSLDDSAASLSGAQTYLWPALMMGSSSKTDRSDPWQ